MKNLFSIGFLLSSLCYAGFGTTYTCSSAAEIQSAMGSVTAGDTIVINPGTYSGPLVSINGKSSHFGASIPGTQPAPVTLKSANPSDKAILQGTDTATSYVLYFFNASYWIIQDLKITGSQKGIVLDRSNHSRIVNCEVYSVGMEAIHLRDSSSNCRVEGCSILDTGLNTAGYGEGVYVGTDKGSWESYNQACYDNVIYGCTFGPNVAAEHIDIKEGTRRTIVEYCTFYGTGITGSNSATTYVSCKGIDAVVRYNTGHRNGNTIIDSAFSCNNRGVPDSGTGNWFYYNTLYHDDAGAWVVRTKEGTCSYMVWENTRDPAGNMYQAYSGSSYSEVDPQTGSTPVPTIVPTPQPTGARGDASSNGTIDIVDALLVAQHYVGLDPSGFSPASADCNCSGTIDIIDALLIAQLYVGLIPQFPC